MRKIVILTTIVLLAGSLVAGDYSGGSGASDDPYQISTTDDLIELSNTSGDWDRHFIQTADIAFNADETQVDWDGDETLEHSASGDDTYGFSPIGNGTTFIGSYDGQNYTIDGLYIERPQEVGIGLFGRVGNTTIRNLGITNADITGKFYTAVLIGSVYGSEQSSVENCSTTGSVNGEYSVGGLIGHNAYNLYITDSHNEADIQGDFTVGGLVGNNVDALEIETCYNTGNVEANSSDNSYAGGLIGYNQNNATVSNSYNQGTVTGNGDYIGGLIGNHRFGQVDNCQNSGDVGDDNAGEFIGGLIGVNGKENTGPNQHSLTNCSSSGNVTGSSRVGGLIGYNYSDSDLCQISSCTNTGDVTASGNDCGGLIGVNKQGYIDDSHHTTGTVSGTNDVGGLVGSFHGEIYNSSSSGSVNGSGNYVGGFIGRASLNGNTIVNNYSNSSVVGGSNVGGFIGATSDGKPIDVTLKSSYCTGNVTGDDYVGGFIGLNSNVSPISNSYSTGDVTRKSSSSGTNIGGFVGSNEFGGITNSYCTGSVYYEGTSDDPTDKGFAGADNGSSSNNFFDSDASNQNRDAVGAATGKTTTEMTNDSPTNNIYLAAGWDFVGETTNGSDDIWNIGNDRNDDYPYLVWENPEDDASLPVELATFTATLSDGQVALRWVTESETDNLGFNVYRSLNKNEHYRKVNGGLIEGAGNSSQKHEYTFVDNEVVKGFTYWYKLEDVDYEGQGIMHGPISPQQAEQEQAPQFRLSPAYPNPFNPVTNLAYEIPKDGNVKLVVYNLEGKVVKTLVNCEKSAGEYELEWNGTNQSGNLVSSGLYFVTITSGNYKKTNKVVFVR